MRISDTLRKNKKNFIIYAILWLIAVIVFIMPMGAGIAEASVSGKFEFGIFLENTFKYIS